MLLLKISGNILIELIFLPKANRIEYKKPECFHLQYEMSVVCKF